MEKVVRRLAIPVAALLAAWAQPTSARVFQEFRTTGERLAGQSSSEVSSTTIAFPGPQDVEGAMSVLSQIGFNVNADAGPDGVAVEVGLMSFEVAFALSHTQSFDLILGFSLHGQLLRVDDQPGCTGSVSLANVVIPSVVRMRDGAVIPIDVMLEGDALDLGGSTSGIEVSRQVQRTINFRNEPIGADVYRIAFTVSATALSQSCEVSARFGAANGSTTNCEACEYPGFGERSLDTDGLFVEVTKVSLCGNGNVDPGEDCDLGVGNGADGTCCTQFCEHVLPGRICRPAGGDCDLAETCTGDSGDCPVDARSPQGSSCTADTNACTDDVCDADGQCVHPLHPGTTCDDAGSCTCDPDDLFCTGLVRCQQGGLCVVLPTPCAEDDICDEQRDVCVSRFGTPTATPLPGTATPTGPVTATATGTAAICPGDCNGDHIVAVNELVVGVNIALGRQTVSNCPAFDRNGDGRVVVNELVTGVNNLLAGCPA